MIISPILEYSMEYPLGKPAIVWLRSNVAFYQIMVDVVHMLYLLDNILVCWCGLPNNMETVKRIAGYVWTYRECFIEMRE